ncbi:LytTR family DNA-binding domain-containing protein [Desulfocurvibacter africanus]|uniref:LytR/AlgR family response regulator transcription factor n=1 Tax=Desulfocurvibacter africanus TaxID=873 RepID=UPI002FD8956C
MDKSGTCPYTLPMTLRCIIADDEPPARDELAWLLSRQEGVELVDSVASATKAMESIHAHAPDVAFVDIHMPGKDGFHVLIEAATMERPPLVVFVTAYDQYAVKAFEENAADYLLKPVSEERLIRTVERLRHKLREHGRPGEDLRRLLATLGLEPQAGPAPIAVERAGRIALLNPKDVFFLRLDGRRVMVHTQDAALPCAGPQTLDRLEERLAPRNFFRVNRAVLVNLGRIREFSPWFNGKYNLIMADHIGTEITVSRSRARSFKERLGLN